MKHLPDLRTFIAELDSIGEITHVGKEVDWNLELGAVARRSYELRAPAPLFENITGIEDGFRVLAAPGGLSAQPRLTYGCSQGTAETGNRMILMGEGACSGPLLAL